MRRAIKRTLLWAGATSVTLVLLFCTLIAWPDPLFAFSLGTGSIVVSSDRPIPAVGGERFLQDCERLLERSPLKMKGSRYRIYVTNESWRQRLFSRFWNPKAWGLAYGLAGTAFLSGANFETGRVVHWGYVGTPPRTLAWLCAHEVTHLITFEHLGLARFRIPQWAFEGLADYVGIENRRVIRAVAGRAWRPARRYSDDGEVRQLSAVPLARHILPREEGLVC